MPTAVEKLYDYRANRLLNPIGKLTPELSEKMDRTEAALYFTAKLVKDVEADDSLETSRRAKVNRGRLFSAADFKNPVTLQSYIEHGVRLAENLWLNAAT